MVVPYAFIFRSPKCKPLMISIGHIHFLILMGRKVTQDAVLYQVGYPLNFGPTKSDTLANSFSLSKFSLPVLRQVEEK